MEVSVEIHKNSEMEKSSDSATLFIGVHTRTQHQHPTGILACGSLHHLHEDTTGNSLEVQELKN